MLGSSGIRLDLKRRTGYAFKQATGEPLWQEGFYDRILRSQECTRSVARYILANPVRAGLVRHPRAWPFLGSEVYDLRELLESACDAGLKTRARRDQATRV